VNGILLIDKPEGPTSADVVRRVKRRLGRVKVGHLGTLDPIATGLLPLCLGEATKIAQFLNLAGKRYEGTIRLGWTTDTGDSTGQRARAAAVPAVDDAMLGALAARFTGEQWQTPPMYSALKRDGVPLYRLARRGLEVERPRRRIEISHLSLRCAGSDRLAFDVSCSKGTYVRVLAEDIGDALGSAAHLDTLRRTGFGSFAIDAAVPLEAWDPTLPVGLVSIRDALAHLPAVPLPPGAADAARQGKSWVLGQVPVLATEEAVLLDPEGQVAAVLGRSGPRWAYKRVLAAPQSLLRLAPMLAARDK
jgi:tRNA pseudouridine55 synthase